MKSLNRYLLIILLADGVLWLKSATGKVSSGNFADTLGQTLTKFASNNPYPWFKSFLLTTAIPNSKAFGTLTMWGEMFVALSLTLGIAYLLLNANKTTPILKKFLILGLLGGMFLNAIFWLASGWTSPSTDSLNLLMFVTEFVGLIYIIKFFRS